LGLRLSAEDARELSAPGRLAEVRDFLAAHGLYVFAVNGFPYGAFHGQAVKAAAFAPDWREPARRAYTLRLGELLAALLPPDVVEGGVSTCPLSYRGWPGAASPQAQRMMAEALAAAALGLARLHARSGKLIHLDLEPEPDGVLESSEEVVRFFGAHLLPVGTSLLRRCLGVRPAQAEALLRAHVRVCYDTCHLAVRHEAPREALARLASAGIAIGRLQLSSALRVPLPDEPAARAVLAGRLAAFAESTYLHQVVERRADGSLGRHADLTDALARIQRPDAREWRIHFHVPLFAEALEGGLCTTARDARDALAAHGAAPFTRVLELETYTWAVLPEGLRGDLAEMLIREHRWALAALRAAAPQAS
jgi:sugar phosphate isomerase/epimerase